MKPGKFSVSLVLSVSLIGCIGLPTADSYKKSYYGGEQAILFKQAAFDLDCPVGELKDQPLSKNYMDIGVSGCGKRAKYKYIGREGWIANTISN